MKRLEWKQTENGWNCDPYQIELLAPGFWILSRRPNQSRWPDVVASGSSLRSLKKRASRLETKRQGRLRLLSYLAWLLAVVFLAVATRAIPALVVPSLVLVFLFALRVIGFLVGVTTGRGWNRLADTYQ